MHAPKVALASLVGALLPMIVACHGDGSPRLQGHWRGLRAEGVGGDAVAAANAFAMGTELEVKGDAITVSTPKDKQSGRYKILRQDKTTLVITTDRDGPSDPQTFTFVDDKTVRWTVIEGKAIVFAKR